MLLAILAGACLAVLTYRGRRREPLSRWAAVARAVAAAAVLLLLFDTGRPGAVGGRPLVLVDHSLSMDATGGQAAEAGRIAASLGDTVPFGRLGDSLPSGRSDLLAPLEAAVGTGRPVVVVTDGEIADRDRLSPALLAGVAVRTLQRTPHSDVTIRQVQAPVRLTVGDTLRLALELHRQVVEIPIDSAVVEVTDSGVVLSRSVVRFEGMDRARLTLDVPWPAERTGARWLDLRVTAPGDGVPDNDVRWWPLTVSETPGIVVVVTRPDWDGRALYQALQRTSASPVTGFIELQRDRWFRMDDLRRVPTAQVQRAARAADLLAVRGDPAPWAGAGRSRLLWAPATDAGDWFVQPGDGVHPLTRAWRDLDPDSLGSLPTIRPIATGPGSWVGLTVRRARRGAVIPVWAGRVDQSGRQVEIGLDGLHRWQQLGGLSAQGWQSLLAASADWLLGSPPGDSARAVPVVAVAAQGSPLRFRWIAPGIPQSLPVTLTDTTGRERLDTLRFDGEGSATLALPVGRYHYQLTDGGTGRVGVEPWSAEQMPGEITLTSQSPGRGAGGARRSWRGTSTLFVVAGLALAIEWILRRRMRLA